MRGNGERKRLQLTDSKRRKSAIRGVCATCVMSDRETASDGLHRIQLCAIEFLIALDARQKTENWSGSAVRWGGG